MFLAVMTGPTPTRSKEIIAYQGVIFKSEGEVAFSDSEWVVVTDFTFDPVDRMTKTLFDLLDGKVGAMTYQYDGPEDKFKKALQHQVELRARSNLEKLKTSHRRLNELKAAVSSEGPRTKRALVDGGGKILSWLFGVSTQEELEHVNDHVEKLSTETTSIVHAMEVHASLINETLWETKAVADAVVKLQTAFAQVENEAKKIDQKIGGITHEIERQILAAVKVEMPSDKLSPRLPG
jgi:methyl-accepting chemotaxis protein